MAVCFSALLTSNVCMDLWRICVGLSASSATSCSNYFILQSRENHVTNRVSHDCDGVTARVGECAFLCNGRHEGNEGCEVQVDEETTTANHYEQNTMNSMHVSEEQIPINAQKMH